MRPKGNRFFYLADVVKKAQEQRKKIAVHCMAGIGRTSTMLLAAHLALGEDLEMLKVSIETRNPFFKLTGPQAKFIQSFATSLR